MPLKTSRDTDRSPHWRIRGTVCGERVDRSSGVSEKRAADKIADRIAAEIRARHIDGKPAKPEELKFGEALINYMQEPGRSDDARRFLPALAKAFGDLRLSEITQDLLDEHVRHQHAGQAPATVLRQTITPLRAVLRHAGVTTAFRSPKVRPTKLRYLTQTEAARLIAAAAPHTKPLLTFLLHTGARMSEALSLEWGDVDLRARRVVFVDTKNGDSRGVPLNPAALEALANIDYPGPGKTRHQSRIGRVFRTNRGAPYPIVENTGGQIKKAWATACRKAQIADATPHTLRHTFASWLVMGGTPLRTVAELMGHKSLNMVMRYSHLAPEHLAAAVDILVQNPGSATNEPEKPRDINAK